MQQQKWVSDVLQVFLQQSKVLIQQKKYYATADVCIA